MFKSPSSTIIARMYFSKSRYGSNSDVPFSKHVQTMHAPHSGYSWRNSDLPLNFAFRKDSLSRLRIRDQPKQRRALLRFCASGSVCGTFVPQVGIGRSASPMIQKV